MFEKAIVGIDGLSGGRDATVLARELADQIALAHVRIASRLPKFGAPDGFEAEERRHSREMLEAARTASGLDAELCPVVSTSVGRGLHELAERIGADLIVVGSSARGLVGRVFQGDETRAALNGAPCAVAIAPGGYAERPSVLAEIGVGYDGSPEGRHALAVARRIAGEHNARVSAFTAVPLPPREFAAVHLPRHDLLEAEVERAREQIAALGEVQGHAAYGEPAEELAVYGASVDLLIVGSRGYGPLGRLVHGRTSLRLARTARCPLLVLPRMAMAALPDEPDREQQTAASTAT